MRLVTVKRSVTASAHTHWGAPIRSDRMAAAAVASTGGMTRTQNHQYSQPTEKPAQPPSARSEYTENEPVSGLAVAISPSIRITNTTRVPARK